MKKTLLVLLILSAGTAALAQDASHRLVNRRLYGGISASYAHIFHISNENSGFAVPASETNPYSGRSFGNVQNGSILGGASLEYFLDEEQDYSLTGRILFQAITNSEAVLSSDTRFVTPFGDTVQNTRLRGIFNYNSLNFELLANRRLFSPLAISAGLGIMIPTQADYTRLFEIVPPDTAHFRRNSQLEEQGLISYRDSRTAVLTQQTKFLVQYYAKVGFQYSLMTENIQLVPHVYYTIGLNDIFTENNSVPFVRMNSIVAGIDFRYGL